MEFALQKIQVWKEQGQRLVFTNGCFDILHYGHVCYLQAAAQLGDRLIVGINTDASVKRLGKGPERPIHDLKSRQTVLEALRCIDLVLPFDQDTPLDLIQAITPHVLVKGGDYDPEQIVGADWVVHHGGMVKVLPFVPGYSTTHILEKLKGS